MPRTPGAAAALDADRRHARRALLRLAGCMLLLASSAGCAWMYPPSDDYRPDLSWQEGNPFGFLAVLASHTSTGFRVREPVEDFVQERHLPALMNLIESDRACAAVILSDSPRAALPPSFSTIGNEAAFLIEGFRAGRYPPRASSVDPPPDIASIRDWWETREEP